MLPKPRRPNSFSEMGGWEWICVLYTLDEQVGSWHHSVDIKVANLVSHLDEGVLGLVYVPFMNHAPVLLSGQNELSSCYSHRLEMMVVATLLAIVILLVAAALVPFIH